MDQETRDEIMRVNAEVMAVQALLFGLATVLRDRGIGQDVLAEAFERADNLAIASSNADATRPIGSQVLSILEQLRKAYL